MVKFRHLVGHLLYSLLCFAPFAPLSSFADVTVNMQLLTGPNANQPIGTVTITETRYGLLFTPNLTGLPPGIHGFHINENYSCSNQGKDAGGVLDPKKTGKHLGPYNDRGNLGDLPVLIVSQDGTATLPVLAPRIRHLTETKRTSLIIDENSDNYSDTPVVGGGGGR